jgi:hypothetical protein
MQVPAIRWLVEIGSRRRERPRGAIPAAGSHIGDDGPPSMARVVYPRGRFWVDLGGSIVARQMAGIGGLR